MSGGAKRIAGDLLIPSREGKMKIAERINVVNPLGLHLRSAARLVLLLDHYQCEVVVQCGARQANVRSIISLISLGAAQGATLEFTVEGDDAEELLAAIEDFFRNDVL